MIYLDHAASSPLDERIFTKMEPWLKSSLNASSVHAYGQKARAAIEQAREVIADIVGSQNHEIIFTSGGTESNNLALFGLADKFKSGHILCSAIEHPSVLEVCKRLLERGFELTILPVNEDGLVDPDILLAHLRQDTIFVSVMMANNEIGTVQPIKDVCSKIKGFASDIYVHSDCVQALPWLNVNVDDLGLNLASFCAHKLAGPKGVGVLFVKDKTELIAQQLGGLQEFRMRAGTENVAAIVGFAEALKIRQSEKEDLNKKLSSLRDFFIDEVLKKIPEATLNGSKENRLCNNVNISISGVSGETLVIALDLEGVSASSGSACHAGLQKASHVVEAISDKERALSCVRFSLGRETKKEEVIEALEVLVNVLKNQRKAKEKD